MQFQHLFSLSTGMGLSNGGLLAIIVVLACLLGAEIACIGILISKMVRARRARRDAEEAESAFSQYRGMVAFLGAVPASVYLTLSTLAWATAVCAVLIVLLLVISRAAGYVFVSGRARQAARDEEERADADSLYAIPEEDELYAIPTDDEGQAQESYTERSETENGQADFSFYAEDEPTTALEIAEYRPVTSEGEAITTTTTYTTTDSTPGDGAQPIKVVEKVVTETVTEIVKEVPPAASADSKGNSTDAVLEKLSDFLDYEMQKRKENEAAQSGTTVATFASGNVEDAYDDEDADEDDDAVDADDPRDEADVDDEGESDDDRFTGNERIIGFDQETGCYIVAHYRKSFEAKLIQARPHIKKYYSELKNALLSYKGSKNRISWVADSFHNGRQPIAKINAKTRILELYLALDPATLEGTVYRGKNVGDKKKYADTPFQYKIRTPRKFKWAMELVARTCEEHGLSPIDIEKIDYEAQYPFDTTDNLVRRNLIKEYIRQEKPATSFELAPDHVPQVPDEDGSVIPANANFSWEFDNEMLAQQPEPEAEEPAPVEESVPEAEPVPTTEGTVVRETVKVTEMRYTERYYAPTAAEAGGVQSEPIEVPVIASEIISEQVIENTQTDIFAEDPVSTSVQESTEEQERFFGETEEVVAPTGESFGEDVLEVELADGEDASLQGEQDVICQEKPSVDPSAASIDLCAIEEYFQDGAVINLEVLKEKGLISPLAVTLRVHAKGSITKRFTVEANQFTVDAVQAITGADGEMSIMIPQKGGV